MPQNASLNDKIKQSTENVSNLVMCRLIIIKWKDFAEASLSFTQTSPYLSSTKSDK